MDCCAKGSLLLITPRHSVNIIQCSSASNRKTQNNEFVRKPEKMFENIIKYAASNKEFRNLPVHIVRFEQINDKKIVSHEK